MDIALLSKIFSFIIFVLQVYTWGMSVYFFMSWLPGARESQFGYYMSKVYEPYLKIFRSIIPPIGIIDISSIAALIFLWFFRSGLIYIFNLILNYVA